MSNKPHKAFVLCAGFGKRLRPHTETQPKPLVEIGGKPLLGHILDALEATGVKKAIVNGHYLASQIEDYLAVRVRDEYGPETVFSHEEEILDTGGGVYYALDHFEPGEPFFVINGDAFWEEPSDRPSTLNQLAENWDPARMDILISLQPVENMKLTQGVGDYNLLPDGRAVRAKDKKGTHMFSGIRINTSAIFTGTSQKAFSYLELMDEAEKQGRLYGLPDAGSWHHISTPEDLVAVRAYWTEKNG